MQQTVSYRRDLRQAGTARGGRHSLVVSSALARELEHDLRESRRRSHLAEWATTKMWNPALYKAQNMVNSHFFSKIRQNYCSTGVKSVGSGVVEARLHIYFVFYFHYECFLLTAGFEFHSLPLDLSRIVYARTGSVRATKEG